MIDSIKVRMEKIIQLKHKIKNNNILDLLNLYQSNWSDDDISSFYDKLAEQIDKHICKNGKNNETIIEIHSGAGGEDAKELSIMFFKSYQKFLRTYSCRITDISDDGGTLITSIPLHRIQGENGIHRILRVHNGKRQTSFISVFIYPLIQSTSIKIEEKDLIIKTCKSSGAGGQHVNKTESAVSITHIPTKISVRCESDRSQHQNKKTAMDILYSKLQKRQEKEKEEQKNMLEKRNISWSNHFRTYSLYDPLIQDNLLNITIRSSKIIDKVLYDGGFGIFTRPYLLEYFLSIM